MTLLSDEETMIILNQFDKPLYDYIQEHGQIFGIAIKLYAEDLKNKNERKKTE